MNKTVFWNLITAAFSICPVQHCESIRSTLSTLLPAQITAFEGMLAELLYDIDRRELASVPVAGTVSGSGRPVRQSEDGFLYARCAVILAGRDAYAAVLADPSAFAPYTSDHWALAQDLLDVASDAYEKVTGETWSHFSPFDYETCSNEAGWQ
jgi:hypothetical protein